MEFSFDDRGSHGILACTGRLNIASAPMLRHAVEAALGEGHPLLVLDLESTETLDSSGLGALVASYRSALQRGSELRIANVGPQLRLVLHTTAIESVLVPYESVEAAARA